MKTFVMFDDKFSDGTALLCPLCGDNYLHHETVTVYSRSEDSVLTQVTEVSATQSRTMLAHSDECGNPSTRRDGLDVEFWCEHCGDEKRFRLCIEQHKGNTHITWRTMPSKVKPVSPRVQQVFRPYTVDEMLKDWDNG